MKINEHLNYKWYFRNLLTSTAKSCPSTSRSNRGSSGAQATESWSISNSTRILSLSLIFVESLCFRKRIEIRSSVASDIVAAGDDWRDSVEGVWYPPDRIIVPIVTVGLWKLKEMEGGTHNTITIINERVMVAVIKNNMWCVFCPPLDLWNCIVVIFISLFIF